MLSSFSISNNSAAKVEKRRAAELEDIRLPVFCVYQDSLSENLSWTIEFGRIAGYEEFSIRTLLSHYTFSKNVTVLEVCRSRFPVILWMGIV